MEQTDKLAKHGIQPEIVEVVERLDEQHIFTTKTLGFLIHPTILSSLSSRGMPSDNLAHLKIADIGTGTGIWLLDVAKTLPPTCQLVGFDVTSSSFPPPDSLPPNVSFALQDMHQPFPESEIGSYDLVAVRFVSSATSRTEWKATIRNLMTLLKPSGGWLQWIDSCNFSLYSSVPGTSRRACQEIYDGLDPFRQSEDLVIGLMMREGRVSVNRDEIWRDLGLVDVHEDVFSSDRLQDGPGLRLRETGTRNVIECFTGCLQSLVSAEARDGNGWTRDKIKRLEEAAMEEIETGVYHTLDQVCIIGRKGEKGLIEES
ncbi:hypothetical protein V8F20_008545 [Naviculisporaceae sp. PSN 640]